MASVNVTFTFHSGIKRPLFQNVRLSGSWDAIGHVFRAQWTQNADARRRRMERAAMPSARLYRWTLAGGNDIPVGRFRRSPGSAEFLGVVTEVPDPNSSQTTRSFVLDAQRQGSKTIGSRPGDGLARRNIHVASGSANPVSASRYGRLMPRVSKSSLRLFRRPANCHWLHRRRRHGNRSHRHRLSPHEPNTSNRYLGGEPTRAATRRLQRAT